MNDLTKKILRISILTALVVVGLLGIILTALSTDFMGGSSVFLFFTVQSNIFIILMALITLVNEIVLWITKKSFMNQIVLYV